MTSTAPRLPRPSASLAAIACLALAARIASAQGFPLDIKFDLPTGNDPYAVAAADLNGDGKLDLVCANFFDATVSVYLGTGNGAFGARTNIATGANPVSVAIADLNGDGRPDLAVVESGIAAVSVLLGNGSGGFGARTDYTVGPVPLCVAIGDLNMDGKPDLAVASANGGYVSVLLNNGSGVFGSRTDWGPCLGARGVAIGDINGDGRPDLVVANQTDNTMSLLQGTGTGTFPNETNYNVGTTPFSVTLGDVNGDGLLDAVTSNFNSSNVTVLLGNGSGFSIGTETNYPTGSNPQSVAIGDVDGDGKPDLVVADYGSGGVSTLIGNGTGGFAAKADLATGANPQCVIMADVNDDGRADLVVANGTPFTLSVLEAHGAGTLGVAPNLVADGGNPFGIFLADLNNDGIPDLAAGFKSGIVQTMLGFPGNTWGTPIITPIPPMTGTPALRGMAVADLNGDGKRDIVVGQFQTGSSASEVDVFPGNGNGTFGLSTAYPTGTWPVAVAIGDLNGDGKPDIVTANGAANNVSVLLNTSPGFGPHTEYPVYTNPRAMAMADFNGDGKLDVAVTTGGGNNVVVLLGTGTGAFGAGTTFATGLGAGQIAAADFNGDGKLDLAVTTANGGVDSVDVLLGTGTGSFGTAKGYPTGPGPNAITTGDFNGDGRIDLATANSDGTVSVLLGDAAGHFGPPYTIPAATDALVLAAGNLNSDGRSDLVVGDLTNTFISQLYALEDTRLSLTTNPPTPITGTPFAISAQVTIVPPNGGGATGAVTFFDGTTPLGSAPVSSGVAGFTIPSWPSLGTRTYRAVYAGDTRLQGSTAAPLATKLPVGPGASISSVKDVGQDEGREVRLTLAPSPLDYAASLRPIVRYDVFRQIVPGSAPAGSSEAAQVADRVALTRATHIGARASLVHGPAPAGIEVAGWDAVGSVNAYTDTTYSIVVPTLADSNYAGLHEATFFVRAATATPSVYYDSAPDSGYSLDNLPPPPPAPFAGAYAAGATHLHWGVSPANDFWYFRL
jgi:hypothetical protein